MSIGLQRQCLVLNLNNFQWDVKTPTITRWANNAAHISLKRKEIKELTDTLKGDCIPRYWFHFIQYRYIWKWTWLFLQTHAACVCVIGFRYSLLFTLETTMIEMGLNKRTYVGTLTLFVITSTVARGLNDTTEVGLSLLLKTKLNVN